MVLYTQTGMHGHWTGTRLGHHQEVIVDCCLIDLGRPGRFKGRLLAVLLVRPGP